MKPEINQVVTCAFLSELKIPPRPRSVSFFASFIFCLVQIMSAQKCPSLASMTNPLTFHRPKFHVGANSKHLMEPLCFYFPFHDPGVPKPLKSTTKK